MKKIILEENIKISGVKNFRGKEKMIDFYIDLPGQGKLYAFSRHFTTNSYNLCKSGIRVNELSTKKTRDRGIMNLVSYLNLMLPYLKEEYSLQIAYEGEIIMFEKKGAEQLTAYVWDDTRSIALMDKFEGIGENNDTRYAQLVFANDRYAVDKNGNHFVYHLVVERRKVGSEVAGNITFTEFKKGYTGDLRRHISDSINEVDLSEYAGKNKILYFEKPYRFRAQNSSNRTGYGWTWDWRNGYGDYTEGTYYGETTEYVFTGIYVA